MPGRVNERKSQRSVELGWVRARDGSPILPRLGICTSQGHMRFVGSGTSAAATATAIAEAISIVNTGAKESGGFLPRSTIHALVEDDEIDVALAAQGGEGGQPPRSGREWVL